VLSWRLSNTLKADFCVDALEEALSRDVPGIFNTDQGSQFTSDAFTSVLLAHGVRISMDSVGSYMDNVFVERLWKSVKYEEVYPKVYEGVAEARAGIGTYLRFYDGERPHQALDYRTPAQVFEEGRGQGPPAHIHKNEDELSYILEGEFNLRLGERTQKVGAGTFIFIPRGTVHALADVGSKPGRTGENVRGEGQCVR
ncbi:MAG: integrase core domain-containing protein, partial [Dehalococcoidia bacterium]